MNPQRIRNFTLATVAFFSINSIVFAQVGSDTWRRAAALPKPQNFGS